MHYISNFSIFKPWPTQEFSCALKVAAPLSLEQILEVLQSVIEQNNSLLLDEMKTNLTSTVLTQALPNGELPLNYAIKHQRLDMVKFLMAHGANPEQQDWQQLNAYDYAILLDAPSFLATLLAPFVSIDTETVKLFIENKNQHQQNVTQTLSIIHNARAQMLTPTLKNVIKQKIDKWAKTETNKKPEFHARLVEELRNDATIVRELKLSNSSILHLIIFLQNPALLKAALEIPEIKDKINQIDARGMVSMHYAVGMGQLDLLNELIKNNAQSKLPNHLGVTPLSLAMFLYACAAQKKSPLYISKGEIFSFISIPAFLALINYGQRYLDPILYSGAFTAINSYYSLTALYNILQAMKNKKLGVAFTATSMIANSFMPTNVATVINLAEISLLGKKIFTNLKHTWQNRHFGRGKALLKAIVSVMPSAHQIFSRISTLGHNTLPWKEYLHSEKFKKLNESIEKCPDEHIAVCTSAAWQVNLECNWDEQSWACNYYQNRDKFWVNNRPASAIETQQFQKNIQSCEQRDLPTLCKSLADAVLNSCKSNIGDALCNEKLYQWNKFLNEQRQHQENIKACDKAIMDVMCRSAAEQIRDTCGSLWFFDSYRCERAKTSFNLWKDFRFEFKNPHSKQYKSSFSNSKCQAAAKTLRIKFGDSEKIAEKAYRKLALELHPDKNPHNTKADQQFIALTNAKEDYLDKNNKCFQES